MGQSLQNAEVWENMHLIRSSEHNREALFEVLSKNLEMFYQHHMD